MCNCSGLASLLNIADESAGFVAQLNHVSDGDWVTLFLCPDCQQLWRIDVWDKLQTQIAVKVPSKLGWEAFDSKPLILESLVQQHGGLSDDACIWAGCDARAVKTVVYCPSHLFEAGVRR